MSSISSSGLGSKVHWLSKGVRQQISTSMEEVRIEQLAIQCMIMSIFSAGYTHIDYHSNSCLLEITSVLCFLYNLQNPLYSPNSI